MINLEHMNQFVYGVLLGLLVLFGNACNDSESPAFSCTNSFTDPRDGEVYCTTTIGSQRWMAQNLRFEQTGAFANPQYPTTVYGKLYTHAAAQQACPPGWHLPTDEEWQTLEATLGLPTAALSALRARGTDQGTRLKASEDWGMDSTVVLGTDTEGFRALPAGEYNPSYGPYFGLGEQTHYWTATPSDTSGSIWVRALRQAETGIIRTYRSQQLGLSCRCVAD